MEQVAVDPLPSNKHVGAEKLPAPAGLVHFTKPVGVGPAIVSVTVAVHDVSAPIGRVAGVQVTVVDVMSRSHADAPAGDVLPVGGRLTPPLMSATFAAQVVDLPCGSSAFAQVTVVFVSRFVAVIVVAAVLPACVASPRYVACSVCWPSPLYDGR